MGSSNHLVDVDVDDDDGDTPLASRHWDLLGSISDPPGNLFARSPTRMLSTMYRAPNQSAGSTHAHSALVPVDEDEIGSEAHTVEMSRQENHEPAAVVVSKTRARAIATIAGPTPSSGQSAPDGSNNPKLAPMTKRLSSTILRRQSLIPLPSERTARRHSSISSLSSSTSSSITTLTQSSRAGSSAPHSQSQPIAPHTLHPKPTQSEMIRFNNETRPLSDRLKELTDINQTLRARIADHDGKIQAVHRQRTVEKGLLQEQMRDLERQLDGMKSEREARVIGTYVSGGDGQSAKGATVNNVRAEQDRRDHPPRPSEDGNSQVLNRLDTLTEMMTQVITSHDQHSRLLVSLVRRDVHAAPDSSTDVGIEIAQLRVELACMSERNRLLQDRIRRLESRDRLAGGWTTDVAQAGAYGGWTRRWEMPLGRPGSETGFEAVSEQDGGD